MVRTTKRPLQLRKPAWSKDSAYADLSNPEWLDDVPFGFWNDFHNHQRYVKWYGLVADFRSLDDWYSVTTKELYRHHGATLLQRYGGLFHLLRAVYPRKDWLPWKFNTMPDGFWDQKSWVEKYLCWLGDQLGFENPSDWYQIRQHHVTRNYGRTLYARYRGQLAKFARLRYPNFDFKPWLFGEVPNGFWQVKKNRAAYVKWLEKKLGFKTKRSWYMHSVKTLKENHGRSVANYYRESLICMLRDLYPKTEWHEWLFPKTPHGFWQERKNCLRYMDWLGKQLGYTKVEDWYRTHYRDFQENHGQGIVRIAYKQDHIRVIQDCFPHYDFKPWLFPVFPKSRWRDKKLRLEYVDWLGRKFGFRTKSDWQTVNTTHFVKHCGEGLLYGVHGGSIISVLREYRPNWKWEESNFTPRAHSIKHGIVNRTRKKQSIKRRQ